MLKCHNFFFIYSLKNEESTGTVNIIGGDDMSQLKGKVWNLNFIWVDEWELGKHRF